MVINQKISCIQLNHKLFIDVVVVVYVLSKDKTVSCGLFCQIFLALWSFMLYFVCLKYNVDVVNVDQTNSLQNTLLQVCFT